MFSRPLSDFFVQGEPSIQCLLLLQPRTLHLGQPSQLLDVFSRDVLNLLLQIVEPGLQPIEVGLRPFLQDLLPPPATPGFIWIARHGCRVVGRLPRGKHVHPGRGVAAKPLHVLLPAPVIIPDVFQGLQLFPGLPVHVEVGATDPGTQLLDEGVGRLFSGEDVEILNPGILPPFHLPPLHEFHPRLEHRNEQMLDGGSQHTLLVLCRLSFLQESLPIESQVDELFAHRAPLLLVPSHRITHLRSDGFELPFGVFPKIQIWMRRVVQMLDLPGPTLDQGVTEDPNLHQMGEGFEMNDLGRLPRINLCRLDKRSPVAVKHALEALELLALLQMSDDGLANLQIVRVRTPGVYPRPMRQHEGLFFRDLLAAAVNQRHQLMPRFFPVLGLTADLEELIDPFLAARKDIRRTFRFSNEVLERGLILILVPPVLSAGLQVAVLVLVEVIKVLGKFLRVREFGRFRQCRVQNGFVLNGDLRIDRVQGLQLFHTERRLHPIGNGTRDPSMFLTVLQQPAGRVGGEGAARPRLHRLVFVLKGVDKLLPRGVVLCFQFVPSFLQYRKILFQLLRACQGEVVDDTRYGFL